MPQDYTGDFSEVAIPKPVTAQAGQAASMLVVQGPGQELTGEAITQWLNDVKDIEEGVTGTSDERRSKRDKRRAKHMHQIGGGLATAHTKLNKQMSRDDAQKVCAQEVRVGFVGILGGSLLVLFLRTLISWAICRWLDWYFKKDD